MTAQHTIDESTAKAVKTFLGRAEAFFPVTGAVLFGSRARGDHRSDSDADLAVFLRGSAGDYAMVSYALGKLVFDVLMETGVEIQPVPIWEDEWAHPDKYPNPAFLRNIAREGVRV